VIVSTEMRHAYHLTSNSKTQITNLACICADGRWLPSMVLFPGKYVNPSYLVDLSPGCVGRATPKGWINTESFRFLVKNIFIKNIPPVRPILLLFDSHGSHIDFQTSKICKENEIELLCLPPHTSHLIQPLDVGVFGPMKQAYRRECDLFFSLNSTSLFNAGTKQAKQSINLPLDVCSKQHF